MALQGTLETFALPDVLRLLASTKKTGCYRLDGDRGSGSLWVKDGQLVGGTFSGSPHATDPNEVTFELLRFGDGEFVFDADAAPDTPIDPVDVESTLTAAEAMLGEWKEIAAVVPSLGAWVTLRAELPSDEVTIRADRWISIVAIAGGTSVAHLGDLLGKSEMPVSKEVKELVEMGIVELGEAPAGATKAAAAATAPAPEAAPAKKAAPVLEEDEDEYEDEDEDEDEDDDEAVLQFTAASDSDEFESFDPNGLIIEEPLLRPAASSGDVVFDSEVDEAKPAAKAAAAESNPTDAAEIARQLANLSPKAAKAVAAAAKATTMEEREAALADVDDEEDPINRELLLKFLGSVNS